MTTAEITAKYKETRGHVSEVATARAQHRRMEFYFTYTGKDWDWENQTAGFSDFTAPHFHRVANILDSADKVKRYRQFFNNPLPAALSIILPDLNAATRAVDKFIDLQLDSEEIKSQILEEAKAIDKYFELNAVKDTILYPSAIVVIDTEENGTPFFWFPDLAKVLAYELDRQGKFNFLVLLRDEGQRAVYCPEFYRLYSKDDTDLTAPILEQYHGLGFCPARFLWDECLTKPDRFLRRTNATAFENELDDYIIHQTSRQYQEMFAKYFITTRIEEKCTVTRQGQRCNGQFFEWQEIDGTWNRAACDCKKSKFLGPGSELQVTLGENDAPGLPQLVDFISPDIDILNFNKARSEEHADALLNILAGGNPEGFNNKAVNEKQVNGIFERKNKLVAGYARTLERAHKFILECFARLRTDGDVKVTVDYGSIFQLETTTFLNSQLTESRAAGSGLGKLLALQSKINTNEAKTMAEAGRLAVIDMLADLPGIGTAELIALFNAGGIDRQSLNYHLQLPNLITRYERERGQIVGDENIAELKQELLKLLIMPTETQTPEIQTQTTTQTI